MPYGENPPKLLKGNTTMNENELTAPQIFTILGVACAATAVAVGLGLRAIRKLNETAPVFGSGKTITELANEL